MAQTAVKLFLIKILIRLRERKRINSLDTMSDSKMPDPEVKAFLTPAARTPAYINLMSWRTANNGIYKDTARIKYMRSISI